MPGQKNMYMCIYIYIHVYVIYIYICVYMPWFSHIDVAAYGCASMIGDKDMLQRMILHDDASLLVDTYNVDILICTDLYYIDYIY